MTESLSAALDAAVAAVRARTTLIPDVGLVLGSGLGALVDAVEIDARIPYRDIPGFVGSTVSGHAGELILGRLAGTPVVVMSGRVHLYEGYGIEEVVFPVRVLARLGASIVVVTNAAGGIHPDHRPEDIMVIRDHINLTGQNPLVGPNDEALGLRFLDMTEAYDGDLADIAHRAAADTGLTLHDGVYAGLLGPSYETPAEIRMLRALGADAVGMSTVNEVIALRHMGVRVLGLSCITNLAAGISAEPLSHEEVYAVAQAIRNRLIQLVTKVVETIGR